MISELVEAPLYVLEELQRHLAPKVRAFIDFWLDWLRDSTAGGLV